MKNFKKNLTLTILSTILLVNLSCLMPVEEKIPRYNFPRQSFMYISKHANMTACMTLAGVTQCAPSQVLKIGSASGFIVGRDRVMTANHVCSNSSFAKKVEMMFPNTVVTLTNEVLLLTDINGVKYTAKILKVNEQKDMCLLDVKNLNMPAVEKSLQKPVAGDMIFNMASPEGIFQPNLIPLFTGIFVGEADVDISMKEKRYASMYSIFATEGSSGSIIMNHKMQIIGMITNSYNGKAPIVIGPDFNSIINFLNN